jgi:hypothetical protein
MHRRLSELDRLDALQRAAGSALNGEQAVLYPRPPRRGTGRRAARIGWVLLALVVTGGLLGLRHEAVPLADDLAAIAGGHQYPPRPADAAMRRLEGRVTGPPGTGGFRFSHENAFGPAAYDPCRPIHLVVNHEVHVPGSDAILTSAVQRISRATGLRFVIDGSTEELAREDRPPTDPERYGSRWSPVLVAWTTPERVPALAGDVAGVGGSTAVPTSTGRLVNVTGIVYLDAIKATEGVSRPGGTSDWRSIVMHELGHVVGLTHVQDPHELMAERNSDQHDLGPGDQRGLAALGAQPCTFEF